MKNSYQNSKDKLIEQSLDFLWRQWTSIGVPGNRAYTGDAIIDPEALVLITTELGRYDSRLLDLAIDWLHGEGKRINLQRLKAVHQAVGGANERVLAGIAEVLAEQSVLRKWRTVSEWVKIGEKGLLSYADEPLFLFSDGTWGDAGGNAQDRRFEKYGLRRAPWTPRDACRAPRPDRPENLLFTLRALFGVNGRAEIMAWLLTHETGHPAAIARDTGYFSKSIQATLNEMEESGLIRAERTGREKHFRLRQNDWLDLFNFPGTLQRLHWISWPWVYYLIIRTIRLLGTSESEKISPRLNSILQKGYVDDISQLLRDTGLRPEMCSEWSMAGKQLEDAILLDVDRLGQLLEKDFRQSPEVS